MLDVPNLGVDPYLDPGLSSHVRCLNARADQGRISVNNVGGEVEYTSNGDRIVKRTGVERDEGRTGVRKRRRTAEGEFESLLEQESTKYHEVVAVTILRLHYLCGV